MWNPFSRKEPAATPRVHVVEVKAPVVHLKRATGGAFRPGMWVVAAERVGVLKSMNEFGVCAVMLVDADGFNFVEMQVPAAELRQAKFSELPTKRVAHLTPEQLERMGYE
jgi:hypothetical protein